MQALFADGRINEAKVDALLKLYSERQTMNRSLAAMEDIVHGDAGESAAALSVRW